jgi:hypothetical protein
LHGRPKDELDGEDIRQHRFLKRAAWLIGILLFVLAVVSIRQTYRAEAQHRERMARLLQDEADHGDEEMLPLKMLLAAESMRYMPLPENQAALEDRLSLSPVPLPSPFQSARTVSTVFTPDGLLVMVESDAVRVWNPMVRAELRRFEIPPNPYRTQVSRDGAYFAAAYEEHGLNRIRVWDMNTGQEHASERILRNGVARLWVGANGGLGVFDDRGQLVTWKNFLDAKGTVVHQDRFRYTFGKDYPAAFSSDGSLFASSQGVEVLTPGTGKSVQKPLQVEGNVSAVIFDPAENNRLGTIRDDGSVKIWLLDLSTDSVAFQASEGPNADPRFNFSPDGRFFIADSSYGSTVRVWDARDGQGQGRELARVPRTEGRQGDVAVDGANGVIAITEEGSLRLLRLPTGLLPGDVPKTSGNEPALNCGAVSADAPSDQDVNQGTSPLLSEHGSFALLTLASRVLVWDVNSAGV